MFLDKLYTTAIPPNLLELYIGHDTSILGENFRYEICFCPVLFEGLRKVMEAIPHPLEIRVHNFFGINKF